MCKKQGNKHEMAKCGRCNEWFHPACEPEEPEQLCGASELAPWYCEDYQGKIDARDDPEDDDEDEDDMEYDEDNNDSDHDEESGDDFGNEFPFEDDPNE